MTLKEEKINEWKEKTLNLINTFIENINDGIDYFNTPVDEALEENCGWFELTTNGKKYKVEITEVKNRKK